MRPSRDSQSPFRSHYDDQVHYNDNIWNKKTSNSPQLPGGMTAISEQLTQHSLSAEVDSVI